MTFEVNRTWLGRIGVYLENRKVLYLWNMVLRQNPKCHLCGEDIKGIYKDQSDTPAHLRIIGDTFLRWDYAGHKCKMNISNENIAANQNRS